MKRRISFRLLIALMPACLLASPATGEPEPDAEPPMIDAGPEEVAERLKARLADLDALRARMTGAIERLRAGETPREVLGPWAWRAMRGFDDEPGFRGRLRDRREGVGRFDDRPGGPVDHADSVSTEEVRAFIDEYLPELSRKLAEVEAADAEHAERMLRRLAPRMSEIIREHGDDPEFIRLRVEELRTGMDIVGAVRGIARLERAGASAEDLEDAKARLRELLGKQFDLRQKLEAHRLEQMRAEIEQTRRRLAERTERRDEVIDEHFTRVLERAKRWRDRDDDRRGRDRRGRRDRP